MALPDSTMTNMNQLTRTQRAVSWICRVTAAVILLQTLFFKFTGAEESVYIFTRVGLEPWGRYATGVVELVAAVLLLTRCHAWLGALLALGVISGALVSHLTVLGIVVKDDGGLLFFLAVTVFITSGIVAFLHRGQIPFASRILRTQKV
jgi:putative oxidoreductase